jgi:hypothetical protein
MKRFVIAGPAVLAAALLAPASAPADAGAAVERWGLFELTLPGPAHGNPFADVSLSAEFRRGDGSPRRVRGFYDGAGVYKVRFMPDATGEWTYATESNAPELAGRKGRLLCVPPTDGNHGPVRVRGTWHFAYADGTPYRQVGTTSYAWVHQGEALEARTLKTLAAAPFNKMRMCVFPKHYVYNANEPPFYPFPRDASGRNDTTRFDPAFWRHFERRVLDLQRLGIEADVILFHPYDRWGYANLSRDERARYLRYVIARLAALRNVWWSLANEFDFMQGLKPSDWDQVFGVIVGEDPYGRLRGIHNGAVFYDHARPWVTHASIQSSELERIGEWRERYRKPVVLDETRYEGDIEEGWGNLTAREMTDRFWRGAVAGAYVGHGETYKHPEDLLWWAKGGVLRGESLARIAFFKRILDEAPEEGIEPLGDGVGGRPGEQYLHYFGGEAPPVLEVTLPAGLRFEADVVDTWDMTVTRHPSSCVERCRVELPRKPQMAVRLRRTGFVIPAEPVTVGWPGELFLRQAVVPLTHPEHRRIHFTLDGSAPTPESPRYETPIVVEGAGLTLRARSWDDEGRPSEPVTRALRPAVPRPPRRVGETAPGLRVRVYEGQWTRLPDFDALAPLRTAETAGLDLTARPRDDDFGLVFEGLVDVPAEGIYAFTTISDDGTRLFVDGERVVDNDGQHGALPAHGEIALARGPHALRLEFFEARGDQALSVEWQRHGGSREPIPAARLAHEKRPGADTTR